MVYQQYPTVFEHGIKSTLTNLIAPATINSIPTVECRMANEEHVALLKQGLEVWNKWREENPDISPDLRSPDLRSEDLSGANLSSPDLRSEDLSGANLSGADLSGADLRSAHLNGTHLSDANLIGADLSGADLRGAHLSGADLRGAHLSGADLRGAHLSGADLRATALINSRLNSATLTDAKLWETHRGGWLIKGVTCQRAFWDREGKEPTEYEDGAFERIFAEKPRIELRYPSGGPELIDFAMLPLIVEQVQARHPGCALHIRSVQDEGSGATVTITVEDLANRDSGTFKQEVKELQNELKYIQGQRDLLVDQFMPIFRELAIKGGQTIIGQITNFAMIGSSMSGDTFNTGQAGAVGPNAHAHDMTFQQVQPQSSIDLPRLAEELAKLHAAMKRESEGTREQDKAIVAVGDAEETASKGDGPTTLQHLKAAGKWTLEVAEKIGVPLAVEAMKRMM
jgi:hypothetical protein